MPRTVVLGLLLLVGAVALGFVVVSAEDRPVERIETGDFTFEHPEAWRVLDNPGVPLRATATGPISQSTVGVSDELVVGVIGPKELGEAITPANVEQLIPASRQDWARMLDQPEMRNILEPAVATHAGLPAIESRAVFGRPFGPTELRVITLYAGRRMYGITCYARLSQPRSARDPFARGCDQVLDSFEPRDPM